METPGTQDPDAGVADRGAEGRASIWERDGVLALVEDRVRTAVAGGGTALLVVAEAGLGKTTVLREAARRAGQGVRTGFARGERGEEQVPFGVLAQLAESLGAEPGSLIGEDAPAVVAASVPYHRILRWLRERAREPLLILLDDLHWADRDSLELLAFLIRRIARLPIGLVATMRPWPPRAHELGRELVATGHARIDYLTPLTPRATAALLAERSGCAVPGEVAERVWGLCRGNPLLAEQLALALARGEGVPTTFDGGAAITEQLVLSRFAGLDPDSMRCARHACILGTSFAPELAAELADIDGPRRAATFEALLGSGLFEEAGERLRFVHPLFAQALYDDIAPPVRRAIHARAFRLLVERGQEREAAAHVLAADPVGDDRAADLLERLGLRALESGAVAAAARNLDAALRTRGDRAPVDLLISHAEAMVASGQVEDAAASCREVLTRPDVAVEKGIEALRILGRAHYLGGAPDHGEAALAEAVEKALTHVPERAIQPLLDLSLSRWAAEGPSRAIEAAEQARDLARRFGGRRLRTRAEATWGHIAFELGIAAGLAATEPLGSALRDGSLELDPRDLVWPWAAPYQHAMNAAYAERYADARDAFRRIREVAESAGAVESMSTVAIHLAVIAIRCGHLDEALEEASRAEEFAELTPASLPYATLVRAEALAWRGELDASEAECARVAPAAASQWFAREWLAYVRGLRAVWEGEEGATRHFEELERTAAAAGIANPNHLHWETHAVDAYLAAGRFQDAERIVAVLDRAAGLGLRWPSFAAALGRARIAEASGQGDPGRLFEEVIEKLEGLELPLQRAEALLARGRYVRRSGHPSAARGSLADAARLFEISGAERRAQVAQAELRLAGGRRRRAKSRDELTPAELRVAREAAAGHANAAIARRLHLSVNTVETHLKRIYAKLGISSRRRLMQLADELPALEAANPTDAER